MPVDYSEDGQAWTVRPTKDLVYIRDIVSFRTDWTNNVIKELIENANKTNSRIEFSQDGGYSWSPFRTKFIDEDAARIFTMMRRDYQVRVLKITQVGTKPVQPESSGSFFRSANVAMNPVTDTTVRKEITRRYVYRYSNGMYTFASVSPGELGMGTPPADPILIAEVRRTTFFSMKVPNTNEVLFSLEGEKRNKQALRVQGFVFKTAPAAKIQEINPWWVTLRASQGGIDPGLFTCFKSARVYDDGMDEFFNGLGPTLSVLNNQFVVGWANRTSLGDTWIVPTRYVKLITDRIVAKGGRVIDLDPNQTTEKEQEKVKRDIQFSAEEVEPKYIMQVRDTLSELIRVGSDQDILDMVIQVTAFRNKCVDELKALNVVLDEARQKIKDSITNG